MLAERGARDRGAGRHAEREGTRRARGRCPVWRGVTRRAGRIRIQEGEGEWRSARYAGNDYDKAFEVSMMGETHTFDSFECAMHALAPVCDHCGVRVAGHRVEQDGRIFCCAHCAEQEGVHELRDRA